MLQGAAPARAATPSLNILTVTTPIYLLIGLGYIAVRAGWLARTDMRVLGQFVLRFALPALLFTMLARRSVVEIFDARFLLAYLGGYTHTEVARLLDLPLGTAKTRIRDGLIRLRDTLGVPA